MTKDEKKLADLLFKIGGVQFGAFRLKLHDKNPNAPLSPIYINLRVLQSYPVAMKKTAVVLAKFIKSLKFELIAAIPLAGVALGEALSLTTEVGMVTPRPPKVHGLNQGVSGVDGVYKKGQTVLLVDDLITRGDSKLEAIKNLRDKGLKVKDLLVLIDREQSGKEVLGKHKIKLHCIFTLRELLDSYLKSSLISPEVHSKTLAYLRENG